MRKTHLYCNSFIPAEKEKDITELIAEATCILYASVKERKIREYMKEIENRKWRKNGNINGVQKH